MRRHQWLVRLVLTTLLLMISAGLPADGAAAGLLYVAPGGHDTNPGTIGQPLATVQAAVNRGGPGVTIMVRGGLYTAPQRVWIGPPNAGASGAPLVLQSYPGERPILDGSAQRDGLDVVIVSADHVVVRGFEIRNAPRAGIATDGAWHVQISDNIVHHTHRAGIAAYNSASRRSNNVTIERNTVYRTSLINSGASKHSAPWNMGIQGMRSDNVVMRENRIYENYGEGIGCVLATRCTIAGNTVWDNYSAQVYLDNATDSLVERNFVYNTGNREFYHRWCDLGCQLIPASGLQMANEIYDSANRLRGNTLRNNIVVGGSAGLYYGSYICRDERERNPAVRCGMRDTVITNNTFYRANRELVFIDSDPDSSNVVIANNIFYQVKGQPTWRLSTNVPQPSAALFLTNNIWYGGTQSGTKPVAADHAVAPHLLRPGSRNPANYRLRSNSPAINAGANGFAPPQDYFGRQRPLGSSVDIGAHER